jgi:large subunit ribosomal protein L6
VKLFVKFGEYRMSKIGENPIKIPENIEIDQKGQIIKVSGPKGELELKVHPNIKVKEKQGTLYVEREDDSRIAKSMHGLTRTLIANMIKGVIKGYSKSLELEGVGYRANLQGEKLVLKVGFSHPVEVEAPEKISFAVEEQKKITVTGIDKQKVNQIAAEIRAIRKPEPYKGKGIRYEGEEIKLKPGKAAKVGEGEI